MMKRSSRNWRALFTMGAVLLYLATIGATTVILIMAANTAFADFPRLGALAAGDGFLPRQLTFRGSRLVYSNGIITLAVIASILIIIYQSQGDLLDPALCHRCIPFLYTCPRRVWQDAGGRLVVSRRVKRSIATGPRCDMTKGWRFKMFINGLAQYVLPL